MPVSQERKVVVLHMVVIKDKKRSLAPLLFKFSLSYRQVEDIYLMQEEVIFH